MPYTIDEHQHRFSAWAAATAASASPLCRFKVPQGVAILEACGFNPAFSSVDHLPNPTAIDATHLQWRNRVVAAATAQDLTFSHGVAAKLINVYLKARFVCAGCHEHERVKCLHPPIDSELLKGLAKENVRGFARQWRKFNQARWSKFDSGQYQTVIDLVRVCLPGQPLWKIEEYWKGHQ